MKRTFNLMSIVKNLLLSNKGEEVVGMSRKLWNFCRMFVSGKRCKNFTFGTTNFASSIKRKIKK